MAISRMKVFRNFKLFLNPNYIIIDYVYICWYCRLHFSQLLYFGDLSPVVDQVTSLPQTGVAVGSGYIFDMCVHDGTLELVSQTNQTYYQCEIRYGTCQSTLLCYLQLLVDEIQ